MHERPIAAGTSNNGHGRGMSQDGSWWWAAGYNPLTGAQTTPAGWQCILDHYYNDNGNASGAGGQNTYRYSFIAGPGGDGLIAFTPADAIPALPANHGRPGRPASPEDNVCDGQNPSDLYTMLEDGSNLFDVNSNQGQCSTNPSWDPTQTQIAYDPFTYEIGIINASGQIPWTLLDVSGLPFSPAWSRENLIAYFDWNQLGIYSVPPTGGEATLIVADPNAADPSWSPTGAQVVYNTCVTPCDYSQVAVADANGGGFQRIPYEWTLERFLPGLVSGRYADNLSLEPTRRSLRSLDHELRRQ
jgi:hypothetical protein